jgi:dGTPase
MINEVVTDLIDTTRCRLAERSVATVADVRTAGGPLVSFSDRVAEEHLELKRFLRDRVYQHYRVARMTLKSQRVVRELFEAFMETPRLLPDEAGAVAVNMERAAGMAGRARAVADYIAGMTDRYAILEHSRLYDPRVPQG